MNFTNKLFLPGHLAKKGGDSWTPARLLAGLNTDDGRFYI
jgi:hypothetical protein